MFGDLAVLLGVTEPTCPCPYRTADPQYLREVVRAVFEDLVPPHLRAVRFYDQMFERLSGFMAGMIGQPAVPTAPSLEALGRSQGQSQQTAVLHGVSGQMQGLGQMFQQIIEKMGPGGQQTPGQEVQQTTQQPERPEQ